MSKYIDYGDDKIPIEEALEKMEEEISERDEEIDKYREILDKIKEELKKHKHDLDYEPWSEYKISGNILFDIVKILEENNE